MSSVQLTVPIYERKDFGTLRWTTLGIGPHTKIAQARSEVLVRQQLADALKEIVKELDPRELQMFQMARGLDLVRLHIEVPLRNARRRRRLVGHVPIVVEPRWTTASKRTRLAYHPLRQDDWLVLDEDEPVAEQMTRFFRARWQELEDEEANALLTAAKDRITALAFFATPRSLTRDIEQEAGVWDDLRASTSLDPAKKSKKRATVLPQIGTDETLRVADRALPLGMPRPPYRQQLQLLVGSAHKQNVLIVGPPGVGKTTLVHRLVADLLEADDYASHKNLDRVHHVWSISGKRIIAGMSYLGEWEQRCIDLLDDVRAGQGKVILHVEDIHSFGRIGRSRDSDRNLADFFVGPLSRGEMCVIGECTAEQLFRLEEDAPSFVSFFTVIRVAASTEGETLEMLLHECRQLELAHRVAFDPFALRAVLDLGGALYPRLALPGKALDLVRRVAREQEKSGTSTAYIAATTVVTHLSRRTGLPEALLRLDTWLDLDRVRAEFSAHVMGQPAAVQAAVDIVTRIKSGLTDSKRPYAVYLLTGPTGTGKTELAKCIASYLYGGESRLVRLDMSEHSRWDATARLIGDAFSPEGLLTKQIAEQPFCVLLLDEIEKAHPSVLNLMLQVFDEGRLTDAAGNTADFTHAVIVMTSNLGARSRPPVGFDQTDEAWMADVERAVKDFFPPELFNRIDRVVAFRPLGEDTARRVARKELARMLARRGLADRNVFVSATPRVEARIVRDGFDPRDGARAVKRYLEDHVGTLLAAHLTETARASIRLCQLFDRDGTIRLHAEPVIESKPTGASYALEPLMETPLSELSVHARRALETLSELERSPGVARISDELTALVGEHNLGRREHGALIYHLDSLRSALPRLRERLEMLARGRIARAEVDPELVEMQDPRFAFRTVIDSDEEDKHPERRQRLYDRRMLDAQMPRTARDEALEALAEVQLYRRMPAMVRDPRQHSISIELVRVGHGREPPRFGVRSEGLLEGLARAYVRARGEVEAAAIRTRDGAIVSCKDGGELRQALANGAEHVVLRKTGLCVLDFFEGETGCHVWEPATAMPEIVRVRVVPTVIAETEPLTRLLERHLENKARFESALEEADGELPPNPEALLPAVRRLRCDLPRRPNESVLLELEDYVLGHATETWVRSPLDPLPRLWLLRMSREPEQPPAEAAR